jgi:hypothetical protein
MASNIARVDAVRSLGFASISGSYTPVGSALSHPAKIMRFVNYTNGDIFISFDGTTDNLFLPSNSFVLFDFTANSDSDGDFRISNRTQIYVKQSTAPTSGSVYVEMIYGQGE